MKIMRLALTAVFWIGLLETASAVTSYVAQGGQTPASPYTSWATAASNIQDAIDVRSAGDTVLVSNGVYQTGGVTNWPAGTALTNRVAITNAITVRSANNNPTNTIIKGAWNPTTTNGPAAVRCVYMINGSALIGFTLTNGATLATNSADGYAGGVYCPSINTVISNCLLTGNSAGYAGGGSYYGTLNNCTLSYNPAPLASGGGSYYGTLNNCTLTSNSAAYGGGICASTLFDCTLSYNSATYGGGTWGGTLFNCTLTSNSASSRGGGTDGGALFNCTLTGNSALGVSGGGGAYYATLTNCTLIGNSTAGSWGGGGVAGGTLYNCALIGNSAATWAGGAYNSTMFNCTIVGNSAGSGIGGGAYSCTLINCIVYFNSAPSGGSNWIDIIAFTNTCTVPAATNGPGNITNDPLFIANGSGYGTNHVAGNYRLSGNSPCLNAGTNFSWMTNTNDVRSADLDGNPRIRYGTVDIGAYEALLAGTIFYIH